MTAAVNRAGRPLATLGAILALWIVGRGALWQSPFPLVLPPLTELAAKTPRFTGMAPTPSAIPRTNGRDPRDLFAPPAAAALLPAASLAVQPAAFYDPDALASRGMPFEESSAHQLMWLAAYGPDGALPVPSPAGITFASPHARLPAAPLGPQIDKPTSRWSFSGWAFLRQGSGAAPPGGTAIPVYGASQAGGVLAYRLAPQSRHAPSAYVRLTAALEQRDDRELATGLSVRPLAKVPALLLAEARWRDGPGGTVVRPSAMVVSTLEPQTLGPHLTAETYAQAGYVGGQSATAFADGQIRLTTGVMRSGPGAVRAGAGAWGGAQRGAARLDLGPTAQIDLSLGRAPARIAVDYRMRVAGDAEPGSGFAVTLSTGF